MVADASMKYHYYQRDFTYPVSMRLASRENWRKSRLILRVNRRGGHFQTGSLAGAAHQSCMRFGNRAHASWIRAPRMAKFQLSI